MITIKKNPETVGKLKVGTSAATPADGELLVSGNLGLGCDPDAKLEVNGDSIWLGNASSDASGRILFNENTTSNGTQGFSLLYAGSTNPTLDGTTFTAAANSFNIFRHTTAWGEAGTVAMSIARDTGLASFSNGITVSGTNNWSHITSSNDQSLSLADDAQIQLADVRAGAMLIHIYEQSAGHGAVIFATYFGQPELVAGSSTYFDVADTDGKICIIKSSSSHDVYLKNRRGSSKNFNVLVTAAVIDNF